MLAARMLAVVGAVVICTIVVLVTPGSVRGQSSPPTSTGSAASPDVVPPPSAPPPGTASPDAAPSDSAEPDDGLGGKLPRSVVQIVRALGYWITPFAIATLIALWFTTERLVVLRQGRVIPKPFVQRFLKLLQEGELNRDEALEICVRNDSPVAHVFAHGVRKWDKPSVEVEQAIIDGGERQVSSLRKHLRVINGVATITPLIGLLGTVWGMLQSFNDIAAAGRMGNTAQLASGIALALVTTAAGLVIAIPSLISYMYLSGRVDSLVLEMDQLAQSVVEHVSSEGLAEKSNATRESAGSRNAPPAKKAV
ncbi:MAG: MotA/TolQ/ExbB proton channel family protein [Planctomycetaceae bacterium]